MTTLADFKPAPFEWRPTVPHTDPEKHGMAYVFPGAAAVYFSAHTFTTNPPHLPPPSDHLFLRQAAYAYSIVDKNGLVLLERAGWTNAPSWSIRALGSEPTILALTLALRHLPDEWQGVLSGHSMALKAFCLAEPPAFSSRLGEEERAIATEMRLHAQRMLPAASSVRGFPHLVLGCPFSPEEPILLNHRLHWDKSRLLASKAETAWRAAMANTPRCVAGLLEEVEMGIFSLTHVRDDEMEIFPGKLVVGRGVTHAKEI